MLVEELVLNDSLDPSDLTIVAAVEEVVAVVGAMGRYYIPSRLPSFVPSLSLLPSPSLSRSPPEITDLSARPGCSPLSPLCHFFLWRLLRYVTIRRAPSNATTTTLGGV